MAFVDAALLKGLGGSKRILRVQRRVAEVEIELAVIIVGGGLGDDLHLPAAGLVVVRRVRILVDADFLHGRGGDGGAVGFDAIDDQPAAAGGGGIVVEKRAHGGDIVVVEDGQSFQVLRGHDGGVVIVVGRGEIFVGVGIDVHVGGEGGDGKNDVQRSGRRLCAVEAPATDAARQSRPGSARFRIRLRRRRVCSCRGCGGVNWKLPSSPEWPVFATRCRWGQPGQFRAGNNGSGWVGDHALKRRAGPQEAAEGAAGVQAKLAKGRNSKRTKSNKNA